MKRCIRILFGNKEAYLDKFKTCCRTRPFNEQILGPEFFVKEHTKPLFNEHSIMTVHNQYYYHVLNETIKILKHRTPISLYALFELSCRPGKETLLIHPRPSDSFTYMSCVLWNNTRSKISYTDFSESISILKSRIKKLVFKSQCLGDSTSWQESLNFLNINENI